MFTPLLGVPSLPERDRLFSLLCFHDSDFNIISQGECVTISPERSGLFPATMTKKGTGPPAAAGGYRFEKLLQDLFSY
jgi:hypothetical protein